MDLMAPKAGKSTQVFTENEIGTIRKQWSGRLRVALVYPNRYHIGMSNLGFQAVYQFLNRFEHIVCERVFLPEKNRSSYRRLVTLESGRLLSEVDILAFSIPFENDFPHVLSILELAEIPLRSKDRGLNTPLVIAGGVACFMNPEPLADFIDCFLIGEAEAILPEFLESYDPHQDRHTALLNLTNSVSGTYVPGFYQPRYHRDGTLAAFEPVENVPEKIKRAYVKDISRLSTCSSIVTPQTTFDSTYLVEVGRGCPHGCRFCGAGYIYRPPRFRPTDQLEKDIRVGMTLTDRIGLVGAAVSDLPGLGRLCGDLQNDDIRISFSSLRADNMTPELLHALKKSRVKTATIAPDAGSERMRQVINKGLTETEILEAAAVLVENGIPNLKLYFMVGLPTETDADVAAIVGLCKKIKHRFLKSSRARKRIGQITVSLNAFVPKPFTPFQWAAMDDVKTLKKKTQKIKNELKKVPNLRINSDVPRWAYIQALFSRGDRKIGKILSMAHANKGNWAQTLKSVNTNPDFYVLRERDLDELFPWDFIDHGINKSYLRREYRLAKQGKTTPDCQPETCSICGVCKTGTDQTQI
jgi:radical SAM family uncharacterized protein